MDFNLLEGRAFDSNELSGSIPGSLTGLLGLQSLYVALLISLPSCFVRKILKFNDVAFFLPLPKHGVARDLHQSILYKIQQNLRVLLCY